MVEGGVAESAARCLDEKGRRMNFDQLTRFMFVDPDFYECIERYRPDRRPFTDVVKNLLPERWAVGRQAVWAQCRPPADKTPAQGWKIHLSATPDNGREVLTATVPILTEHQVAFKFALDRRLLALLCGKNWPRAGAGKFLTIYPRDGAQFHLLLGRLHEATRSFEGPHILSDRRFSTSKVVHYRYGTMLAPNETGTAGESVSYLTGPGGLRVPDRRVPYFALPPWVSDPVRKKQMATAGGRASGRAPERTLKDGAYTVLNVLSIRSGGGVYLARDNTREQTVVLKEARPHTAWVGPSCDSVTLLRKEFRLLSSLKGEHVAPEALDLFQDWEHWFLVEEHLQGRVTFQEYIASVSHGSPVMRPRLTRSEARGCLEALVRIAAGLTMIILALHEKGIVFVDLSPNNILINPRTLDVKLVDFEAACERGVDKPVRLGTPGFTPKRVRRTDYQPEYSDDLYSLGAIMFAFLFRVNPLIDLKPDAKHEVLAATCQDFGFPTSLKALIVGLLHDDSTRRPKPRQVLATLDEIRCDGVSDPGLANPESTNDFGGLAQDALLFAMANATPARRDRLFPADARIFITNGLSIAYGACGTAYALQRVRGRCPAEVMSWIEGRLRNMKLYPPGLYLGLAGVAWVLLELGRLSARRR